MAPDPTRHSEDKNATQQRFLSLFLRSEREIFRYVAGWQLFELLLPLLEALLVDAQFGGDLSAGLADEEPVARRLNA